MDQPSNQDSPAEADVGTPNLSIVIQQPRDEDSPRVFLVHVDAGATTTYATDSEHPYELALAAELPQGDEQVAVITKPLSTEAAERFRQAMKGVSEAVDSGLVVWTPLRPSAAFASNIWEATFNEKLAHRSYGLSTPEALAQSIAATSARDLGLAQDAVDRKKLQVSKRNHERRRTTRDESAQQETEEQARRRGQSH
tara:strand:- start:13632 stop:14222 length:591 start_codon:yes stop_codon:yes gene_type:complete